MFLLFCWLFGPLTFLMFLSLVRILFVPNPQVYCIMLQYNCCITRFVQKLALSCDTSAFLSSSSWRWSIVRSIIPYLFCLSNYRVKTHSMRKDCNINWTERESIESQTSCQLERQTQNKRKYSWPEWSAGEIWVKNIKSVIVEGWKFIQETYLLLTFAENRGKSALF